MSDIRFTPADIEALRFQRFHHPHPHVQRKMEALLLKSAELPHHQIADIVGVCENTVRNYFDEFLCGGVEALKELRFYTPVSELMQHRQNLEAFFRQHPLASIKEAAAKIHELTGVKRGLTQTRKFLSDIGLKRRKVGSIPAKADRLAQETFKNNELQPRLEEAKQGTRSVFFIDAAHFVFAPFLGYLWSFSRLFVQAPSGRKRFNVLGALNAVTHELVMVTNQTYINASSVCALLREIAGRVAGPITLVLDNARYQKCQPVRDLAAELKIELLYLPAYSPNLNLIERLWKFVKKQCLYNRYYPDFAAFQQAISGFLETVTLRHARDLDSLLTLNFQVFEQDTVLLTTPQPQLKYTAPTAKASSGVPSALPDAKTQGWYCSLL